MFSESPQPSDPRTSLQTYSSFLSVGTTMSRNCPVPSGRLHCGTRGCRTDKVPTWHIHAHENMTAQPCRKRLKKKEEFNGNRTPHLTPLGRRESYNIEPFHLLTNCVSIKKQDSCVHDPHKYNFVTIETAIFYNLLIHTT